MDATTCRKESYYRGKSALFAVTCLLLGALPHWFHGGPWPAMVVALLVGRHIFPTAGGPTAGGKSPSGDPEISAPPAAPVEQPTVDLVVAAKNEAAVIEPLVQSLLSLRYGQDHLQLWIVDDGSVDGTAEILDGLQEHNSRLHVVHRPPGAGGWKSGALNAVLPQLQGEWVMVLDADAQVDPHLLEHLQPLLQDRSRALQLRKAVSNSNQNLLTQLQAIEMAFDGVIQKGRIAHQGSGELRGNGQFIPREALLSCGGFNEETVTDDLDLSVRLQLQGTPIDVVWNPPVGEEAVSSLGALWRQRQRWAEGGLQRFLDHGPALVSSHLPQPLKRDVLVFFLLQYVQPLVVMGDAVTAVAMRSFPLSWPLTAMTLLFTTTVLCRCPSTPSPAGHPVARIRGLTLLMALIYLFHWSLVIPFATLRMGLQLSHRTWDKTLHKGLATRV